MAFTEFFLTTCIDQVTFMEVADAARALRARILTWAEEEIRLNRLPPRSGDILEAVLYRGELPRAEMPRASSAPASVRPAASSPRCSTGASSSPRARARRCVWHFPPTLASRWMPGLFPERAG